MNLPENYNNLTREQRRAVREEYIKIQNNKCYHCGGNLDEESLDNDKPINLKLFPKDFLKWPVHLHHHHDTGYTIGAVHAYCNAVLWQYYGE